MPVAGTGNLLAANGTRPVASRVFSDEGTQDGMDALFFARPAVPVLPAPHPLECPLGSAAHAALGPFIGRGFAHGLPAAVDKEPHEDEDDDSGHEPVIMSGADWP
jgi:hypothetical protein